MTKHKTEQIYQNDWISRNWRPYMAWAFLAICIFDFILGPVGWTILQGEYSSGRVYTQWEPMTLRGGGLFYLAMGAILGISSYGRTQEKIASLGFGVGIGGGFAGGTLEENTTEIQTIPTRNR